ncbi:MAG TPA: serine protease [Acidimicrobiia bacterium]
MRSLVRVLCVASLLAGSLALFAPATSVGAIPPWAPAGSAAIHPGVQTNSPSGQCTSNFVFYDGADNVYIGQAAHCTSTGDATSTNGCEAGSLPLGTEVTVDGASQPAVMVYNSWLAMQAAGETDPDVCAYNDFALLRLAPADAAKVNPSIPHWGGPNGINTTGTPAGETVYSYGNSSLRLGLTLLSPKTGLSLGDAGNGWSHDVLTVTPGIPGDSGSAFLDASGRAVGVLSTLQLLPLAGSNGVGDLSRELAYVAGHGGPDVALALGTEAFDPGQLPLGL